MSLKNLKGTSKTRRRSAEKELRTKRVQMRRTKGMCLGRGSAAGPVAAATLNNVLSRWQPYTHTKFTPSFSIHVSSKVVNIHRFLKLTSTVGLSQQTNYCFCTTSNLILFFPLLHVRSSDYTLHVMWKCTTFARFWKRLSYEMITLTSFL